jgi:hypothetical protein
VAYHVNDPEGFGNGDVAPVKNRMGSGRLLVFATGAPSRKRRFSLTIISMSALSAGVSLVPFPTGKKLQTCFLGVEISQKLLYIKLFK